jgi:hypothetical protein
MVPESRRRYSFPVVEEFPASLLTLDNGYVQSLIYQAALRNDSVREADLEALYEPQYLTPYHGAQLVESLLNDVCASPWTNVTSDNNLFRRLLSSYILHQYRSVPNFRKELFLRDMASRRTTSCSQLLVNIVLACASVSMTNQLAHSLFDQTGSKRVLDSQTVPNSGCRGACSISSWQR